MPKGGGGELRFLYPKNIKELQFTLLRYVFRLSFEVREPIYSHFTMISWERMYPGRVYRFTPVTVFGYTKTHKNGHKSARGAP